MRKEGEMNETERKYDDIIHRERPVDEEVFRRHPRMSPENRAKIFSPFSALRGYDERLAEENVKLLQQKQMELSEEESKILSEKLQQVEKGRTIVVTCFRPDSPTSEKGYYTKIRGRVKSIDKIYRHLEIEAPTGENPHAKRGDISIRFDEIVDINLSQE